MDSNALKISYVMGQMRCQFTASQLQPLVDHYTGQQIMKGELAVWMPAPPLELNLRDLKNPQQLSSTDIESILNTNPESPNIMIFIHGYNIGLGDPGRVLLTHSKTSSTCQQVEYGGLNKQFDCAQDDLYYAADVATVYRSAAQIQQQFGAAVDALDITDDRLNGSGAHNWWRHMEYNLNKAAGFERFDYHFQDGMPQYTRILNIAWAGDPISALDYMAVEPIAAQTAEALLKTVIQLKEQHIEINIIAHSAGNIVLIKLMELLGREAQYHNSLHHVFMWQAAIPDNALSPDVAQHDQSLSQFWHTSHAYLSACKIHVLYSCHDNILGPVALNDVGIKDLHFAEKWHTAGGGKTMAATALSLEIIDQELGVPNALKSCYNVAHLFHAPFNAILFNSELRHALYKSWYAHYGRQLDPQQYHPTLEQQIAYISQHDVKSFNDIALFVSLYSAIIHDGISAFLINMQNDTRLASFLETLPPDEAQYMMLSLMEAAQSDINYDDWLAVYQSLKSYAHHYISFKYLLRLWETVIHHSQHWLKSGLHDLHTYLQSLTHDMVLHAPRYYIEKHIEINNDAWHYLLAKFHHHQHGNTLSCREQGYRLAQRGSEVAAFVITMLNAPGNEPRPAMGYSGVDHADRALRQLVASGKITCTDQSQFLFHHSAMKMTNFNDDVFKKVYQQVIMNAEGIHFGVWR